MAKKADKKSSSECAINMFSCRFREALAAIEKDCHSGGPLNVTIVVFQIKSGLVGKKL